MPRGHVSAPPPRSRFDGDLPPARRADAPNPRRGVSSGAVVRGATKAGKSLKYGRAAGAALSAGGRAGSAAAAAAARAAAEAARQAARRAMVRARALTPAARPPLSPSLSPSMRSQPRGRQQPTRHQPQGPRPRQRRTRPSGSRRRPIHPCHRPDNRHHSKPVNGRRSPGDCFKIGVSGPTRRAEVRRDGHCE